MAVEGSGFGAVCNPHLGPRCGLTSVAEQVVPDAGDDFDASSIFHKHIHVFICQDRFCGTRALSVQTLAKACPNRMAGEPRPPVANEARWSPEG